MQGLINNQIIDIYHYEQEFKPQNLRYLKSELQKTKYQWVVEQRAFTNKYLATFSPELGTIRVFPSGTVNFTQCVRAKNIIPSSIWKNTVQHFIKSLKFIP